MKAIKKSDVSNRWSSDYVLLPRTEG